MSGEEYRIITAMRDMEWERVKGMLNGIITSFWDDEKEYDRVRENVRKFISAMDDGWELTIENEENNESS